MGSASSVPTEDAPPSYDAVVRQDLEAAVKGNVKDSSLSAGGGEAQVESKLAPAPQAPLPRGRGRGSVAARASAPKSQQQPPPKEPLSREVITGAVVGDIIFPGFGFIIGPYLVRKSTTPNSEPSATEAAVAAAASSEGTVANVTASSERPT